MGGDGSKNKFAASQEKMRSLSSRQSFLSVPAQVRHGLFRRSRFSKQTQPSESNPEWTLPAFISVFLPEFPQRFTGHVHLQILGFIAKGSFGPILKVKDLCKDETYAIKVLPKADVLKHRVLQQSKEEVIIQRQVRHPFLLSLQDCWQSQDNLFIMCEYCSTGDLYTYWTLKGRFDEKEIRVFAAELGSALGFLHDFGIIHRDVKMENILLTEQGHLRLTDFGLSRRLKRGDRAFTICGTIQYMAPEVLSGGPYGHAADWWSLGILIYSLATGGFPVPAEADHCKMLTRVTEHPYDMPAGLSPDLAFLLIELLCRIPTHRLRCLEHFRNQRYFRGMSFDSQMLQKSPIEPILELKNHPDRQEKSMRGLSLDLLQNFECDLLNSSSTPEAPQGCVLSPLLFSLYTNECTSTDPSVKLLKFADDTTVIGLIQDGDESAYRKEVAQLAAWCSQNNLELNAFKTVEMIVDFRRNPPSLPPLTILDSTVDTVESFRFLGSTISQDLKWESHIDSIVKKAQQRLYFLRQLRKFNLPQELLTQFYSVAIQSVLCTSITVWYGSATKSDLRRLQRTVRSAEKIIGAPLPTLQDLYDSRVKNRARKIIIDSTHPAHKLFDLLPSGRRFRAPNTRTSRHRSSFFPQAISLLNR
ncbi:RAC serine/threonine-protein kinase isoform X2 [Triplophysa rosa]|uniref:RAC serine/threonine-protein kinase isoform X2 n=1 Tax=Triplophysa rosa TaxID=992332 RepID=UPI00254636F1|nr:RAC serine/threonine-protein kinase isoform X2 [Triplophysa rosa]